MSGPRRRAGIQMCAECDASVPQRIEHVIRPKLLGAVGYAPFAIDDVHFGGRGCIGSEESKTARPDIGWAESKLVVFGEIDEDGGHPHNPPECELGRMWTVTSSVKQLLGEDTLVYFVRMNPDSCDAGRFPLSVRIAEMGNIIKRTLEMNDVDRSALNVHIPHVTYMYYHSRALHQIDAALAKPDAIHVEEHCCGRLRWQCD